LDLGGGGEKDDRSDDTNVVALDIRSSAEKRGKLSNEKTLSELRDALLKAREYKLKTVPDVRRSFDLLIKLHGDLTLRAVTRGHIRELRDVLLRYPVGGPATKLKQMDLREIGRQKWGRTISPVTVGKLLGFVSQGFRLAVSEGWCEENPRSGLIVGQSKTALKTERSDFQDHHLKKLFLSPLFTGCLDGQHASDIGNYRIFDHRYWLPILALYTGARLGELAQLEASDVKQENGIWFLNITKISAKNKNKKSLKTKHSERSVPIHKDLISLGFLGYAKSSRTGYVFESRYETPRKLSHEYSKWFGRYLTAIGLDDRELVFHSFRHTFKTACRFANVPDEIHDELTGHRPVNVGGWYGERKRRLEYLSEVIDGLIFDGL
ncbi:site-specific integrase, partial [Thalassospira marina]